MPLNLRVIQLLKIRNQLSSKALRNYGLYFALILFITYHMAGIPNSAKALLIITMSLTSLYFAERQFFPQVKDTMNTIHFLTNPSQPWEKWLAELIHTFFIIPAIALIPVLTAIFIVKLISSSANNLIFDPSTLFFSIKTYWISHPLLFFGAIYFRNAVVVKTFGSVALLAIASAMFVAALTKIFPPINYNNIAMLHNDSPIISLVTNSAFQTLVKLSYFSFFWLMSYLSLVELESQ